MFVAAADLIDPTEVDDAVARVEDELGGIGLLVTLLVRANRHSQQLLAYGLSDHYRQIFELTRLDEAVGIHDSEQAALRAAGAAGDGGGHHG